MVSPFLSTLPYPLGCNHFILVQPVPSPCQANMQPTCFKSFRTCFLTLILHDMALHFHLVWQCLAWHGRICPVVTPMVFCTVPCLKGSRVILVITSNMGKNYLVDNDEEKSKQDVSSYFTRRGKTAVFRLTLGRVKYLPNIFGTHIFR